MKLKCPFNKKCKECKFYTKMYSTNKDGKVIEVFKCAIEWIPILLSELKLEIKNNKDKK